MAIESHLHKLNPPARVSKKDGKTKFCIQSAQADFVFVDAISIARILFHKTVPISFK